MLTTVSTELLTDKLREDFNEKKIRISNSICSARICVNDYNYFHIQTIPIGDFFRVNYRIIKCFWKCRVARRVEVFNHGSANGVN